MGHAQASTELPRGHARGAAAWPCCCSARTQSWPRCPPTATLPHHRRLDLQSTSATLSADRPAALLHVHGASGVSCDVRAFAAYRLDLGRRVVGGTAAFQETAVSVLVRQRRRAIPAAHFLHRCLEQHAACNVPACTKTTRVCIVSQDMPCVA
jgi:hypothetical protein